MPRISKILALVATAFLLFGCNSRTDKADSGGVILSVSDFDGLPLLISVTNDTAIGISIIESIDLELHATNPDAASTDLMTVEMETYEVTFTRNDSGQRVPPSMVRSIGGSVQENGEITYGNLVILTLEQLDNPPLSDLQAVNGGFDRETGSDVIVMNLAIRFYGRTIAGNRVISNPFGFTVNFVR